MSDRFFLDSSILIYSFDNAEPSKSLLARGLVSRALGGSGVISYQVIQECLNIVLRRSERPPTVEDAREILESVLTPLAKVHPSPALFVDALRLYGRHNLSWYDSLIVAAALQTRCRVLYSEDLQAGLRIDNLTVVNPFVA